MDADLYELLEIEKTASSNEVKKAYRKLALRYHPDKVQEEQREDAEIKFKEVSAAYEILIDEAKREEYDTYGTFDGMRRGGGGVPSGFGFNGNPYGESFGNEEYAPEDFFNFFNGMGTNGERPRQNGSNLRGKTEDAQLDIEVTLEDLYKGKIIKSTSTRNIICGHCKGTGARPKAVPKKCGICDGSGTVRKIRRLSPGVITQDYVPCTDCKGKGQSYRTKDKCKKCDGKCLKEETKILEFEILKGSKSGESVVLKNESDEAPGKITGDVILTFTAKKHPVFTRKDNDLFADLDIPLVDALSGFSRVVTKHLDGRAIKITTPKGKVIRPNDYLKISKEGMPIKNTNRFGDLYLKVNIIFPNDNWWLEKNDLLKLKNLFPIKATTSSSLDEVPQNDIENVDFVITQEQNLPEYADDRRNAHEENYYGDAYGAYEHDTEPQCAQQ